MSELITDEMVVKVLRQAAERLTDEAWTQGENARDAEGRAIGLESAEACQWCMIGAVSLEAIHVVRDHVRIGTPELDTLGYYRSDDWKELFHQSLGALRRTLHLTPITEERWNYVNAAGVAYWNDTHQRRADEVRERLIEAADEVEQGVTAHG